MAEPEKDAPTIRPEPPKPAAPPEEDRPARRSGKKDDGLGPIPLFTQPGRWPKVLTGIGKALLATGATIGLAKLLKSDGTRHRE